MSDFEVTKTYYLHYTANSNNNQSEVYKMKNKTKLKDRQPFLLWLDKGDRLKIRIELLRRGETITGFLQKAVKREIGEDSETSKQARG